MSDKLAILAAGGTGGHMFPAQSLSAELKSRGWEIILTTDERGMRYADGFGDDVRKLILPTASFSQGSLGKRLGAPTTILKGYREAKTLFNEKKPDAVVGFGGYPSLPSLMAARRMKVPYFIHEQNAVLGRVNRRFQSRARTVACGLWPVKFAKSNAVFIGNPVRQNVLEFEATRLPKGLPIQLLVFGGSQGASALSKIVPHAVSMLPENLRHALQITQQARKGEIEEVMVDYGRSEVNCEVSHFFNDLPARIADSHFVIARAGASTLAELQIVGRGSILVPLPSAANDHQRANAQALVAAGAAFEFDQDNGTAEELAIQLQDVLTSHSTLERMADSAYRLARPDAVKALADLIEDNKSSS